MTRLSLISALLAAATAFSLARPAGMAAQAPPAADEPLRGRVLKDGEPVAGVEVTLHRVTSAASGAVAQVSTDARGGFRFDLPPADSVGFTVFFATAEFNSVRHFGPPLHPSDPRGDYRVEVYDTTAVVPPGLRLARRDVVLLPQTDGSWEVNEVVRLHNPSRRTLVSGDGMPTVELRVPESAADFQAGEGDLPPDQVRRMGERVLLLMPVLPGDLELFFRYRLPAREKRSEFALTLPVDTMNLFVRQPSPELDVQGLAATELVTVQGERFLQFSSTGLAPDRRVQLSWRPSGAPPVQPVVAGVVLTLLVLAAGTAAAVRSRGRAARAAA